MAAIRTDASRLTPGNLKPCTTSSIIQTVTNEQREGKQPWGVLQTHIASWHSPPHTPVLVSTILKMATAALPPFDITDFTGWNWKSTAAISELKLAKNERIY